MEVKFDTFEGFTITRAKLHQSIQVPLHGESDSLYDKRSEGVGKAALTGVEMKFNGVILVCRYKGKEFCVPAANVSVGYLSA